MIVVFIESYNIFFSSLYLVLSYFTFSMTVNLMSFRLKYDESCIFRRSAQPIEINRVHGNGTETLGQHSNLLRPTVTIWKGPTHKGIIIFHSKKLIKKIILRMKHSHKYNFHMKIDFNQGLKSSSWLGFMNQIVGSLEIRINKMIF